MSLFINNIPQPGDNLDFSQGQLLSNNSGLDTVFGIDHYKFSDATSSKGFHNQVTTPAYITTPGTPPVTGTSPIFYALQQTAPLGVLQYSRGPSAAVPSPLTKLHSTASALIVASLGTLNILDFTGINISYGDLYLYNSAAPAILSSQWSVFWNGSSFQLFNLGGSNQIVATFSGNILQMKNITGVNFSNVYWTLDLVRIQ